MKKIISVFCLFAMLTLLTGCQSSELLPKRTEIDDMSIIQMLAIDKSGKNDIELSILKRDVQEIESEENSGGESSQSEPGGSGASGNSQEKKATEKLILGKSSTMSQAEVLLQKGTEKNLFFGDLDYFIFGSESAKDGLYKYIDHIIRENGFRMDTLVYLSKASAKDTILKSSELDYFLPDYLDVYLEEENFVYSTEQKTFISLFEEAFDDKKLSVIPLIEVKSKSDNPSVLLDGYGILKDLKLVCYVEGEAAKGYNLITNNFNEDVITVNGPEGEKLALSVGTVSCSMNPQVKNGKIEKVSVSCRVESSISEDENRTDFSKQENIDYLQEQQAKIIKKYLTKCIDISQKEKCDFIHLFKKIRAFYGDIYKQNESDWDKFYSKISFEIEVDSKVMHGYDSRERIA